MNVVEPILFQCRLNPVTTAICTPGAAIESISYGLLERAIHSAARAALRAGVVPGYVVAILIADTIVHAAVTLGLMRLGVATLSLREAKVPDRIAVDAILTDVPQSFAGHEDVLGVDPSWIAGDGAPLAYQRIHPGGDDDLCRIILTSGSTGEAKGVAFSHRMLAERIAHYTYSKGPRFAHCPRFFCDLGFGTSPGFRYAMALLSRGGTIYFLGPDPADMLQAFDLHRIQGMATSPYGLGEFVKFFEADSAFTVGLDHIICQGARLSPELSRRARARLCQNLYSSYGSTETTTVAFGPASIADAVPGAVGTIQPGVTVEAVDKSGVVLPAGREGTLRIRTRHAATGYVGDLDASRAHFRDGCFYPGDTGLVTRDGLLVVTGREKTALNIGGDTVSPERVEAVIAAIPGIAEAGVFAADNELGIAELCAVVVSAAPVDEPSLRAHCGARLPPSCVPGRIIAVDALPRGPQGKLERHRLPDIAEARLRTNAR